ncbi:MAG TPA: kelch repeat-containing protein [Candidatus Dormibacteraeota bacterium]|nr:kelch repeat-containing protein [Candidatus Dormibacteraeota bacterium]
MVAAVLLVAACGGTTGASSIQTSPSPRPPGPRADTWTWDGAAWHATSGPGPSARFAAALAYDEQHKTYVLFGGQTRQGSSDETWLWDGKKWTAAHPAHKPTARRNPAMAYDRQHKVVVLYGGLVEDKGEGTPAADTWSWDGSDWSVLGASSDAGQRLGAAMVATEGKPILFGGGAAFNDTLYGDAFAWDGRAWTRIDREPRPPARYGAAVAWNPGDSSLLVFGGNGLDPNAGPGAAGTPLGDTWSLKGGAWTRLASTGPPATGQPNAIWQSNPGRLLVMFGMAGTCRKPTNAMWAWDGTAWSQLASAPVPPRWGAALAQAPDGSALVFGGSDEPSSGC